MKPLTKKSLRIMLGSMVMLWLFGSVMNAAPNPNPTWYVDGRVVYHGQCNPYDYYAAKDPTIVYYGGKYHVFYTGANQSGGWQMLYTSASTISGLASASRTYMSKIGESYFCAPEVFYFEPKGLWYLVYQDGTYGAAYATTTNIADPNSWSGPKSFGISGNMGWDYFVICDDTYAYMYNTPSDGSGNLYLRKTTLANFPTGWSAPAVSVSNVFEGAEVYKSLADGKYYLLVENMTDGRYYELFTASSAGGPWTLVAQKWAWRGNLVYNADKWTTNVSHGELIRAGYNQKLEINDINRVDFLIQGTTNTSGDYQKIIWDLGVIRNYSGSVATPTPTTTPKSTATPAPTATPTGSVLFSDNFESGSLSNWTATQGTWSIVTDGTKVLTQSSTTEEGRISAGNKAWTNCSVKADIKVDNYNSNRVLLCGRFGDANNYYAASLYNGATLEIRKKVGGSSSTLTSKTLSLPTGSIHTIELEMIGSGIKVFVDGTQQLTAIDSALSSGSVGLVAMKAVAKYDNIVVTAK